MLNSPYIMQDIERFTVENINKISLVLLENASLRDKHLDNFLIFILKTFKNEAECLSKLKVMDTKRINQADGTVEQIFATVLSIKGIRLAGDIEAAAILLTSSYNPKIFSRLVRWYFKKKKASRKLTRDICSEIFKIKRIARIKEVEESSDNECSEGSMLQTASSDGAASSEEQDAVENTNCGLICTGSTAENAHSRANFFFAKKKVVDDDVAVQRLLKLLNVIVCNSGSNIKDFYHITTLLRMRNKTAKEIVNTYIRNLKDYTNLESCFIEGLRISPKMIFIFPQVYRKVQEFFNWAEFIDVIKERPRLDIGCLNSVKVPPEMLGQILYGLKMGRDVVKSQIRKMNLDELLGLKLPRNRKIEDAIQSRIDNIKRKQESETKHA